jgi:RND family efflux transporter MFP subunit
MTTQTGTPEHDLSSLRIRDEQRKGSTKSWRAPFFLGVFVLLACIAGSVHLLKPRPKVEVAVARSAAAPKSREALLDASGYVTPQRRATIAAKITGRVTGVFFDEGAHVRVGQLLATLDNSDALKALDTAKADRDSSQAAIEDYQVQLKNARLLLRRTQELQKAGVVTQEQLDNAQTAADSLAAKIDLAKTQAKASETRIQEAQQAVDNCTIRAPFDGIVVSKDAQVGEMVSPVSAGGGFTRTGIATIVDMTSNEIEVDVNEGYIARVRPGQPITAVLDAYPDWKIPGRVRTIIPSADRQKATVKVRISFVKLDPRILPDMGVKVAFLSEEPRQTNAAPSSAVLIPQNAVHDDGGQKVVFLLKANTAERRAISLGISRGPEAEVVAGLIVGDTVIVSGPGNLHEGQAVQIKR